MELFTHVSRKFKKVFLKQEQLRNFPVYDVFLEVCNHHFLTLDKVCNIFFILTTNRSYVQPEIL